MSMAKIEDWDYYYLTTVKSLEEMNEFRLKNFCIFYTSKPLRHFKSFTMPCYRKKTGKTCDFELMAMCPHLDEGIIHIYAHSQHSHVLMSEDLNNSKEGEQSTSTYGQQNMDEQEQMEEEDEEGEGGSKEIKFIDDGPPPRNIIHTKNNKGQRREYYYLKTVKSNQELDKFRVKNYCLFANGSQSEIWKSCILPCKRKKRGKICSFELLALRPNPNMENGDIHVYAYSWHSHPLDSKAKRLHMAQIGKYKYKMPAAAVHENPPMIFDAVDNITLQIQKSARNHQQKEEQIVEDEEGEEEGKEGSKEDDNDLEQRGDEERKVSIKTEDNEENLVQKEGESWREERVDGKQLKANEKVYNWMEGIDEPIVEDKKMMNSP